MHADVSRSRESGNLEKEREREIIRVGVDRARVVLWFFARERAECLCASASDGFARSLSLARCRLIDGDRMLLLRESKREEREGEIVEAAGREKDTRRA